MMWWMTWLFYIVIIGLLFVEHMQPKPYVCGNQMAVNPSKINYLTYEQMFFINATQPTPTVGAKP